MGALLPAHCWRCPQAAEEAAGGLFHEMRVEDGERYDAGRIHGHHPSNKSADAVSLGNQARAKEPDRVMKHHKCCGDEA